MVKLSFPNSQESLVKDNKGILSTHLDYSKMVKSASDGFPRGVLEQYRPDDDHFAVHAILLGDYEHYGPNRNGDSFPKKACQDYHPCFVKFGHFFRHHNNKSPDLKIGDVKASAYNDPMGRVELILHGHKKLAEEEYEMVKAGKQLVFSMSCKVPYDICSICGNEAPKRADYCDHLKYEMCKIYENGKQAHAINDKPYFFDASRVVRPADRIAYGLQTWTALDPQEKSASIKCGADMAEEAGIKVPELLASVGEQILDVRKMRLVEKLAELEKKIDYLCRTKETTFGERLDYAILNEYPKAFLGDSISDSDMAKLASVEPSVLLDELARRGFIFSFEDFARYVGNKSASDIKGSQVIKAAREYFLPELFQKFGCGMAAENCLFDQSGYGHVPDEIDCLMDEVADRHGMSPHQAKIRMVIISIDRRPSLMPKLPSTISKEENPEIINEAKILAEFYGLYKVAALAKMEPQNLNDDLLTLSIMQNKINPTLEKL